MIGDLPAGAQRLLEAMLRGVDRMDSLVASLIDLMDLQGGIAALSLAPLRLDELVTDVVAHLPRATASRVRVNISMPVEILGDSRRLRQVARALLDNALKYSEVRSPVEVRVAQADHAALLTVVDQGFGIPKDKADRVFEKFYRAHAGTPHDAGGIGVGLFVAKKIVEQHGGRIWFDSVEKEGTVFSIELPLRGT
jgi:signal transduction histidine kinase